MNSIQTTSRGTRFQDLTGQVFSLLTVVSKKGRDSAGHMIWNCLCACGKKTTSLSGYLKHGNKKSCGCLKHKKQFVDLTGKRFGKLTVLSLSGRGKWKQVLWTCQCDCGGERIVSSGQLTRLSARDCGCVLKAKSDLPPRRFPIEYRTWQTMIARCTNESHKAFKWYGAKGIVVCKRWIESFENFLADIGPRPAGKYGIDRIDNNGNYEPNNCRWATAQEQTRNRSITRFATYRGVTKTIGEWAEQSGIPYDVLFARFTKGKCKEENLFLPVRQWGKTKK